MDWTSIFGTLLGCFAVLGGQLLEGGELGQLTQFTSALIVFGGTLGAVILSFPKADIQHAIRRIPDIYKKQKWDWHSTIDDVFKISTLARKEGLLAIEAHRALLQDPLLRKSIKYVVDGFDPQTVREMLENEVEQALKREETPARVFEVAGGFAPTIGILGAVLGLIHVMTMLNEPAKIGEGIAVAFIATVYGVGFANLILFPWANKLKRLAVQKGTSLEIVRTGVLGIQEGLNPHFLKSKLELLAEDQLATVKKKT